MRDDLSLAEAIKRVNLLTEFYAAEKVRQEDNLIKTLLPAALTLAALLTKQVIDSNLLGLAIFLVTFFLSYALLIYHDLYAAERVWVRAHSLQAQLYQHEGASGGTPLKTAVSSEVMQAFEAMESNVGRIRYCMPTGKPLIAGLAGAAALCIFSWT
ncbi:MAG TPA: hypothetical protein VD887_01855 [Allosphingosinicella sp.]|nr:hypothetical protein [Allosphingosinicella sp.]